MYAINQANGRLRVGKRSLLRNSRGGGCCNARPDPNVLFLRKAAERSLIDEGAIAEFTERVFKDSLKQVQDKLRAQGIGGNALEAKALEAMRKPAIGCFVAGTLVHTKEGLKPIEQIKVGDWVLSRPEDPEQGTQTGYKRVTKTFRFEDKEVVCFSWAHRKKEADSDPQFGNVIGTPNHPVWSYPHGWVAMGRLRDLDRRIPGTLPQGGEEWFARDLVHHDGSPGERYDVFDLYRTDLPHLAFDPGVLEDSWGVGGLLDFSTPPYVALDEEIPYDYEKWGDPVNETRERYCTTVYNIEVEDWHTYFVSEFGLWVHNTNCAGADLEVRANNLNDVGDLIRDAVQMGSGGSVFKDLTRAELNHFLKNNPAKKEGFAIVKVDGSGKYTDYQLGDPLLPREIAFQDMGAGALRDAKSGLRYEFAVLINPDSWAGAQISTKLAERLAKARYIKMENSHITESGTRVWGDRKVNATSMSGSLLYKPLDQLFRWSLAAQSNPVDRFLIETVKDSPTAFRLYKQLIDNIRSNNLPREIRDRNGKLLYSADDMKFVLSKIRTHLLKVDEYGHALKDASGNELKRVLELVVEGAVSKTLPFPQNVVTEGSGLGVSTLDLAHVYVELNAARQYWLDQGASLARLNQASFAISDLPQGWAARTQGSAITFDASGAGWGWFVDTSPQAHSEFTPASPDAVQQALLADYQASPGSAAEGKLDLLTVLIHELGHVLGVPMPQGADNAGHAMSQYLAPGQRRLPDAVDIAALLSLGWASYQGGALTVTSSSAAASPATMGTTVPVGPVWRAPAQIQSSLTNGSFATGLGNWETHGNVSASSPTTGAVTLGETSTAGQTHLAQAFVITAQDRFLTFTVSGLNLQSNSAESGDVFSPAPQDAFEVALQDANTGQSLTGSGLAGSHSDALLNVQLASSGNSGSATGFNAPALQHRAASALRHTDNADGSRTYVLDLSGLLGNGADSRSVNLSFDLIGFGQNQAQLGSQLRISDVRLFSAPVAVDDNTSLAEDSATPLSLQANDLNASAPDYTLTIVSAPQHGSITYGSTSTQTNQWVYTPHANYSGPDSFSYRYSNASGTEHSNTAVVSITVTAVNDAPIASDVSVAMLEDGTATINLVAQDDDSTLTLVSFVRWIQEF